LLREVFDEPDGWIAEIVGTSDQRPPARHAGRPPRAGAVPQFESSREQQE
jgi:hypothetical protein